MKIRLTDDPAKGGLRLAFPALWTPQSFNDGNPAWGAKLIVKPKSPYVKEIDAAMKAAAHEQPKWKGKADQILAKLVKDDLVAFHKSDYTNRDGDAYEGFEDMFYLSCRSEKTAPSVFDRDKSPLLAKHGRPYSGCYVTAVIEFYAQDNGFGRRINASLSGVQFSRDGDAFSGGVAASADEFEDLSDGTDEDDEDDLA